MYTFKYCPPLTRNLNDILFHLRIAALADKYDIGVLEDLAYSQFAQHAFLQCNSSRLAAAIEEVYRRDELDKYKQDICARLIGVLHLYKKDSKDHEAFWDVVKGSQAFAVDLLQASSAPEYERPRLLQYFTTATNYTPTAPNYTPIEPPYVATAPNPQNDDQ